MRIAIVGSSNSAKCIWDHAEGYAFNNLQDVEGVLVDEALFNLPPVSVPVANTCVAIKNLILNPDLQGQVYDHIGVVAGEPVTSVFALFNGKEFSEFLEVSSSEYFMTQNVGPKVGFTTGTGLRVGSEIYDAVPALARLRDFLTKSEYRGEVLIELADNYLITDIRIGHCFGHFALFSELAKCSVKDIVEFIFGGVSSCALYDSIGVANLISLPPFPSGSITPQMIHAPKGAEKHLWRFPKYNSEVILITCHGMFLQEARKRVRRTIENIQANAHDLQYRVDYGYNARFLFNDSTYERLRLPPKVESVPPVKEAPTEKPTE